MAVCSQWHYFEPKEVPICSRHCQLRVDYASIEGEAVAVVYALHQTRYYVLGCKDLIVATGHKPLLQILNERSLTDIDNRRLLNLKEKL